LSFQTCPTETPAFLLARDSVVATFFDSDGVFFIKGQQETEIHYQYGCLDVATLSGEHFKSEEGGQFESEQRG
jgi:hypothetical protein